MKNPIDIGHLFEEAISLYYGTARIKDVTKALAVFKQIMEIGKTGWGETVYPDIFNDYVYYRFDDGSESHRDYELAARLYDLASGNGSLNALNNLGFLYLNGLGVDRDINRAKQYWEEASDKGDNKSRMNLVGLYKTDQYGMLDYSKAVYYCDLAAKSGDQQAAQFLPVLRIAERRFYNNR